jgi:hypothetical protein
LVDLLPYPSIVVYDATIKGFPGAFLLVSAGLNILGGLIFLLMMTKKGDMRKFELEREGKKMEL